MDPRSPPPGSLRPPRPGVGVEVMCAVVAVLVGFLGNGFDGRSSDLAIQRTLVAVRRAPAAFPGDLVADHALAHPGWLFDLLALLPEAPWVFVLLQGVLLAMVGVGAGRALRALGGRGWAMLLVAGLIVLPRALLAESRLVHPAPIARNLALALQLWGLGAALARRSVRAGIWGGLALGAHPTTGSVALLLLALVGVRGTGRWGALGVVLLVGGAVGGAVLLPWLWLGGFSRTSALQAGLMELRLGHHLDVMAWDVGGWGILALHLGVAVWGLRGPEAAPLRGALGVALIAVAAGAIARPVWLPGLARLHLGYAAGWVAVVAVLAVGLRASAARSGRARWGALLGVIALSSGVEGALVAELPGGGWVWRPVPPAASVEAAARSDCLDRAGARLEEGRPVFLSIKDGGELVGSPVFAARWASRVEALCGPGALQGPAERARGWQELARRCKHVPPCGPAVPPLPRSPPASRE